MPSQCSRGLAKNKCRTSNGLDLFPEEKDGNNQIGMWLDSHARKIKFDISNRRSYDEITSGWECGNEWNIIKEEGVRTEWVTSAKLLRCIQSKMNRKKNGNNSAVCGVWIERMHRGLALFNQALGAQ